LAKLFVIKDTPDSIALGSAVGVFLGFTPLFGLKTLLALGLAWAFRASKIAAVVGVCLHDLLLPFWPALYFLEFEIGCWLLHEPHQWPLRFDIHRLDYHVWLHWKHFAAVGGPMLLGSVILGAPTSLLVCLFLKRVLVRRAQRQAEVVAQRQ
jgi:hypothetical protein